MIIAVVVTYNRLEHLKRPIAGLFQQTLLPEQIIVVNNDSSDGTAEWLNSNKNLVVIHQENTGGSGGFHTGVKAAYERNAEWIWMMDDDVVPRLDCLEKLLAYSHVSKCLNPVHFDTSGQIMAEETWFDPESCHTINHHNLSYRNGKKIWFRNTGWFEGMLVAREIVTRIGFPDPRFFISRDDLVYGFLAHMHTNVAVVADAIFEKQEVIKREQSKYNYDYYKYRNSWIVEEYLNKENNSLKGYRSRRVQWQFLYAVYKVFRLNEFKSKRKAIKMYWEAYKDYKNKIAYKKIHL